jgi:DNA-binding HxlR family transcriptional regulator
MTEMVGSDLQFEPVGGPPLRNHHDPGVVDQDVEVSGPSRGELADRREAGEIQLPHVRLSRHRGGGGFALARGLDVIGDRWTLLVVRELLAGSRRYSELLEGLPGIATNLLADPLRSLEERGVVARDSEGGYQLTEWGQGLSEVLYAVAR